MKIILYLNSSEAKRLNKTSFLEVLGEYEGFLRYPTTLLNPDIKIALPLNVSSLVIDEDGEDIEDSDGNEVVSDYKSITMANYAYIPEFRRYYFVDNIKADSSGLFTLSMSGDPLMSFKDHLLELIALVSRNEFEFNRFADDDLIPYEMNEEIIYSPLQNIAPADADIVEFSADMGEALNPPFNFLLNAINKEYISQSSIIDPPSGSPLPTIHGADFSLKSSSCYVLNNFAVFNIAKEIIDDDNLNSYVKSLIAFPFEIRRVAESFYSKIKLGDTEIDAGPSNVKHSWGTLSPYIEIARFSFPSLSEFNDFAPYTRYELFIPFLGYIDLDSKMLSGHSLSLYYAPNYEDGSAQVYLYDLTANCPIYVSSCQLGIKLAFDSTNNREITDQRTALGVNTALGALAGIFSLGVGIATMNPLAMGGGSIALARSVANAFNKNAMLYEKGQVSYSSGLSSLYSPLTPFLRIRKKKRLISDDSRYAHSYGKPLQDYRLLSSVTGFTTISSIHLEGVPALKPELDSLETLLRDGVIF